MAVAFMPLLSTILTRLKGKNWSRWRKGKTHSRESVNGISRSGSPQFRPVGPKNTCFGAAEKSTLHPYRFKHLLSRRRTGFWAGRVATLSL